jgi:hypothetical protein
LEQRDPESVGIASNFADGIIASRAFRGSSNRPIMDSIIPSVHQEGSIVEVKIKELIATWSGLGQVASEQLKR